MSDPELRVLTALARPVRLAIVRQLAGAEGISACDFHDCCAVQQPTVSHHLRVLRLAGVVQPERRGTRRCYRLTPPSPTAGRPCGPLRPGRPP